MIIQIRGERPYSLILTGDFNRRSSQWWEEGAENPEGTALDELIETNDLYQLINEPTNIRDEIMTCIDLIITDQQSFFVESGVQPSLDDHCQYQIIYGKLNLSIPALPPPHTGEEFGTISKQRQTRLGCDIQQRLEFTFFRTRI